MGCIYEEIGYGKWSINNFDDFLVRWSDPDKDGQTNWIDNGRSGANFEYSYRGCYKTKTAEKILSILGWNTEEVHF